jgi:hypothetical protein
MKSTLNGPSLGGNTVESFKDARGGMRYEKRADGRTAIYGPGNRFLGYQSDADETGASGQNGGTGGASPGVAVEDAVKPPSYAGAATPPPVAGMPADTDNSPEARAQRLAASKADGSFAQKRKDYNAQNLGRSGMDEFGTIRQASATAPTPPAGPKAPVLTAQEMKAGASVGPGTGPKGSLSYQDRFGNTRGEDAGGKYAVVQGQRISAQDYDSKMSGANTQLASERSPKKPMSALTYQASLSDPKKKFGMRGPKSRGRLASMA